MKENRVNKFINAVPDSVNSKYKHLIYLENNLMLTGYSGKVGMREKDNDIDNFINYVLRLMKSDYYPGSSRDIESMDFYFNQDHELIVKLRTGHAIWETKFLFDAKWKKAHRVIETMFELLAKQWPPVQVENKLRIQARPKIAFDPTDMTAKFTSDKALVIHCQDLIRKGYAQGEVETYLRNYRVKYFNP